MSPEPYSAWIAALEERHLAGRRVQEITRALRALSSVYVERRSALGRGAALDTAGKRAAFALFYGPLHYLLTRHIVGGLASGPDVDRVIDLGCGTGAAGSAWAIALGRAEGGTRGPARRPVPVLGVDRHPWAAAEARWTYRAFGLDASVRVDDVTRTRLPRGRNAVILAFTVNELPAEGRTMLLPRLLRTAGEGSQILVVEPVARSIGEWWAEWATAFQGAGGREDAWRFDVELPRHVRLLDKAAGLDHRVLTARSLFVRQG